MYNVYIRFIVCIKNFTCPIHISNVYIHTLHIYVCSTLKSDLGMDVTMQKYVCLTMKRLIRGWKFNKCRKAMSFFRHLTLFSKIKQIIDKSRLLRTVSGAETMHLMIFSSVGGKGF